MAWTTPATQAYGTLITTNIYNNQIINNLLHLGAMKIGASALSAITSGMLLAGSGFLARKTATQSTTSTVTTKITWDAEDYDPDSAFDLTNERYTAPSTGRYLFNYRVSTANDAQITFVAIYVNGSEVYRFNGAYSLAGSIALNLAAGDYVELFIQQGATQNINNTNNITWWGGVKVGLA